MPKPPPPVPGYRLDELEANQYRGFIRGLLFGFLIGAGCATIVWA